MEITAGALANMLGGTLVGDPDKSVTGFSTIEEASEGDLTFISNPKYSRHASSSNASVILVSEDFEPQGDVKATLLRVADPYAALAYLMRMAEMRKDKPSGIQNPVFIDESAKISDDIYIGTFSYVGMNVEIGKGSLIYPQVFIGDNCTIGKDCIIYPGVKIYQGCEIGNRCIIHSGAVIGSDGFGFAPVDGKYEKIPQIGKVSIEDDVEIGANTTIDRATFGKTVIGKGSKLDNLIQVAHNVRLGENNVIASQAGIAGSTQVGDNNRIGGQCGFAGHIKIGNNNEFGAQSGIHTNIGDNKRLIGYPAVDIMQFAKTTVYLRRLDELFKQKK